MPRPRVAIVGAGFGGLHAARGLARLGGEVIVVDRQNYHLFQPLLYQVATGVLSPGDVASPIRWLLRRQPNARVLLAEVSRVDANGRFVELSDGDRVEYDALIVAAGARHAYFGHPEWERHAPGLKDLDDAIELRRRILLAFERAEREADPERRRRLLTFAVIGGGPTGVELAGALAAIAHEVIVPEFRTLDPAGVRIMLVEATPAILPGFPASLQAAADRTLARIGVEVRKDAPVTGVEERGIRLNDDFVEAATILWAAGVQASPVGASLGAPTDRAGRVRVEPDLSVPGHREIFIVGDLACFPTEDGRPLPGVAPVAIQQGRHAARNVSRRLRGEPTVPFRYRDRGSMAVIGRGSAVADLGRVRLTGRAGWLAWLIVHLVQLIGFRNRLMVLLQWGWYYFTFHRAVRLITGAPTRHAKQRH